MKVTAANCLDVFYDLLKSSFSTIRRYGYDPTFSGEFIVLNHISNTRETAKVSGGDGILSANYGITYVTAFVPKISNGSIVLPDSARIKAVQTLIVNLIESFEYNTATARVNSIKLYMDGNPDVYNDSELHSKVIFRVITNFS